MRYDFLIETYATERIKVLTVWSCFRESDLPVRPHPPIAGGRQRSGADGAPVCERELWFRDMLGWTSARRRPRQRDPLEFLHRYAEDSARRLDALRSYDEPGGRRRSPSSRCSARARGSCCGVSPYRAPPGPADDPAAPARAGALTPPTGPRPIRWTHGSTGLRRCIPNPDDRALLYGEAAGGRKRYFRGSGSLSGHRATRLSCDASRRIGHSSKRSAAPKGPVSGISARGRERYERRTVAAGSRFGRHRGSISFGGLLFGRGCSTCPTFSSAQQPGGPFPAPRVANLPSARPAHRLTRRSRRSRAVKPASCSSSRDGKARSESPRIGVAPRPFEQSSPRMPSPGPSSRRAPAPASSSAGTATS